MRARRRSALVACVLLVGVFARGIVQAQEALQVTVTHYALSGLTYSGGTTHVGMAACSFNIPIGATVRFSDGREYRCEDRGSGLGSTGWIDIWVPDVQTARQLGRYTATVEVIR